MLSPSHASEQGPAVVSPPPDFDYDAIHKLPPAARYFNVSVLWIPYYTHLVRLLYSLRVRHEVVTLLSLGCGLWAAYLIGVADTYAGLLAGAFLAHLKDAFDASDGALARLTGTGHRLGRFMDTIGDGIAFTALIAAVAIRIASEGRSPIEVAVWAVLAWISLFLQCSYFNYYHLQYTRVVGGRSMSCLDEEFGGEGLDRNSPAPVLMQFLQFVYRYWFGWQDRLVARIDRLTRAGFRNKPDAGTSDDAFWYGARRFLTANSALCFGTHVFVLILCLIVGKPAWFLPAVAGLMNVYLGGIIVARLRFRG